VTAPAGSRLPPSPLGSTCLAKMGAPPVRCAAAVTGRLPVERADGLPRYQAGPVDEMNCQAGQ